MSGWLHSGFTAGIWPALPFVVPPPPTSNFGRSVRETTTAEEHRSGAR